MDNTQEVVIEVCGIRGKLIISDEAFVAVAMGQAWQGQVELHSIPVPARMRAAPVAPPRPRQAIRATPEQRRILRAWNRSPYITQQASQSKRDRRNFAVPRNEIAALLPAINAVMHSWKEEEVIALIERYFAACTRGEHIHGNDNFGYKSLSGFLEKLRAAKPATLSAWWLVQKESAPVDPNKELTVRIANSYARTFMGVRAYPEGDADKAWMNFAKASVRLLEFRKLTESKVSDSELIKCMLTTLCDTYADKGESVSPAHLASEYTWLTLVPHYIKEHAL